MRRLALPLAAAAAVALVAGALAPPVAASPGGRPLTAALSGANEVPPGDPDGSGTAAVKINPGRGQLCFVLTVAAIAPASAAHIHVGQAGVNGPVVVGLSPPTGGTSTGCVDDVGRGLLKAIMKNPERYYVNVHNADYPGGAVRGQLSK